jgi:hypothetical protein
MTHGCHVVDGALPQYLMQFMQARCLSPSFLLVCHLFTACLLLVYRSFAACLPSSYIFYSRLFAAWMLRGCRLFDTTLQITTFSFWTGAPTPSNHS